jgi:hypothetical protein
VLLGKHEAKLGQHEVTVIQQGAKLGQQEDRIGKHQAKLTQLEATMDQQGTRLVRHERNIRQHETKISQQERRILQDEQCIDSLRSDLMPIRISPSFLSVLPTDSTPFMVLTKVGDELRALRYRRDVPDPINSTGRPLELVPPNPDDVLEHFQLSRLENVDLICPACDLNMAWDCYGTHVGGFYVHPKHALNNQKFEFDGSRFIERGNNFVISVNNSGQLFGAQERHRGAAFVIVAKGSEFWQRLQRQ